MELASRHHAFAKNGRPGTTPIRDLCLCSLQCKPIRLRGYYDVTYCEFRGFHRVRYIAIRVPLTDGVVCYIREAAASLGYPALKPEQEEAIIQFLMGRDVFVALPTGYGKSLCYCCLPRVFDRVRSVEEQSIVVVVSPLTALINDQVAVCHSKGLTAGYVIADRWSREYVVSK